jgi:hypothetical protein
MFQGIYFMFWLTALAIRSKKLENDGFEGLNPKLPVVGKYPLQLRL